MVYMKDLKSFARKGLRVRISPWAPISKPPKNSLKTTCGERPVVSEAELSRIHRLACPSEALLCPSEVFDEGGAKEGTIFCKSRKEKFS